MVEKQLLDPTSTGYSLHAILRDYVLESMATPNDILECHMKLGELFENEWKKAPEKSAASAQHGSLAYFHSISAGRQSEAEIIKFAYLEEAKEASVELYRRGKYKEALAYLENIKKIDNKPDPFYDFYYALSLNRLGRSKEALSIIRELAEKFPNEHFYHHGLGTILKRLHREDEAADSFRKAIATAPRGAKPTPLCSLANLLCEQGKQKDALPLIKKALEIAPTKPFVVAAASNVLEKTGDISGALKIIMEALKLSPTDTKLHHRAGMVLKKLGNFAEAKNHFEIAISDPALVLSYTALADVYVHLGDIEKAEATLERFPGDKKSDPSYLSTKGNILRLTKNFAEAERFLRKANNLEPSNIVHCGGLA